MESDFLTELSNENYEVVTAEIIPFDLYRSGNLVKKNNTCPSNVIPSLFDYFAAIHNYGIALYIIGAAAVLIVIILYTDTVRHIIKNAPSQVKTHSVIVLAVYPVVSIATYCAMVVPRANLLAEAITQSIIMTSMYQLFCLFVAYCGGETKLIQKVKPDALKMRVRPCCCWSCLPILDLNKDRIKFLRLLILQLPLVQGLIYMVLLVMWAEQESLYQLNYVYFQPVSLISILFGFWGIQMTMRMLKNILKDHEMSPKFRVLQMTIFLNTLQGYVIIGLVSGDALPCNPPLTPTIYSYLIKNSLLLAEMVLLSIIARRLYKKELPEITESNNNIEQIYVSTI